MKKIILFSITFFMFQVLNAQVINEKKLDNMTVAELIENGDRACKEEGDYSKGIIFYNKAIEMNKDSIEIYKKRGSAYFASKDFDNAVSDFSIVINGNPDDIAGIYIMRGLSKSLLKNEDKKGACEDFRMAKKLGYDLSDMNGLNEYCGVSDLE